MYLFLAFGACRAWVSLVRRLLQAFLSALVQLYLLALWVRQKFRVRHISGGWWRRAGLRALLDIGYPAALEQGLSIRLLYLSDANWQCLRH